MGKVLITPGQKRKRILMAIIVLLALILTALGGMAKGHKAVKMQKLAKDHGVAIAVITDLEHKEVKYRKKKRKKIKHVYTIDIEFQAFSNVFKNTYNISESEYTRIETNNIKEIEVWYNKKDPSENYTKKKLLSLASQTNLLTNMASIAIVIFPVAIVVYMVISILFIREPKGYIPDGFVTENSWLDVDDGYLVVLEEENLVIAKIDDKKTKKVQSLYQKSEPLQNILEEGKCKVTQIPLADITKIESEHHSDTFSVKFKYGEDEKSSQVEFLNPTVKEHALERISPKLPSELEKSVKKLTRFQSTIWSIISMAICGGLIYFFIHAWFMVALGGLGLFFAVKSFITRLIDPTVLTKWMFPETQQEAE